MILHIYADSKRRTRCRSCGADITFARLTGSGKLHPFNGQIVATLTEVLNGRLVEHVNTDITSSHFATCPDAKDWKRHGQ